MIHHACARSPLPWSRPTRTPSLYSGSSSCNQVAQSIDEHRLLGVQQRLRLIERHKACLIHFPGRTRRLGVRRGWAGESVDLLAALGVCDAAERRQLAGANAGLFPGLATGSLLQIGFAGVDFAFRDAPGLVAVVIAARMDDKHFEAAWSFAVEQGAGGLF